MSSGIVVTLLLVALCVFAVVLYNKLVALRNRHINAFSQIDVQLQRRHELIPNLVEIAKGYLKHENETLVAVTEARNNAESRREAAAASPGDGALVGALASAEGLLGSAMGKLNVVMEAYPELKADERMADLHAELASTENRVSYSRQAYSDAVMRYNTACEEFPAVVVASLFRFKEAVPFELETPEARQAVKVSFA